MYLLNSTKRYAALAAATVTLLDNVATAVVSAAASTVYIEGEVDLPFSAVWLTVILLILFSIVAAAGLKESATLAFGILALHVRWLSCKLFPSAELRSCRSPPCWH